MHTLSPFSADAQPSWVEISANAECDTSSGEVYLQQSPGKVSTLDACQTSCQNSAKCRSITYFRTGWCSHYSTACTKVKSKSKTIAMRLTAAPATTAAPKTTHTATSMCPHGMLCTLMGTMFIDFTYLHFCRSGPDGAYYGRL